MPFDTLPAESNDRKRISYLYISRSIDTLTINGYLLHCQEAVEGRPVPASKE